MNGITNIDKKINFVDIIDVNVMRNNIINRERNNAKNKTNAKKNKKLKELEKFNVH